ncbi:MAG: hypothetical protein IPJ88_04275 [Myxococcales bacterium]|nr:MAG: hypothetical protein IPJ88_04275 [Myxococcales bacterium]
MQRLGHSLLFRILVTVGCFLLTSCSSDKRRSSSFDASTDGRTDGDLSDSDINSYPDGGVRPNLALVPCQWHEPMQIVENSISAGTVSLKTRDSSLSVTYTSKRQNVPVVLQKDFDAEGVLGSESEIQRGFSSLDQPQSVTGLNDTQLFAFIGTYFSSKRVYTRYFNGSSWSTSEVLGSDTGPALSIEAVSLKNGSFSLAWSSQVTSPQVQKKKLFFATVSSDGSPKHGPTEVVLDGDLLAYTLAKGEHSALVVSTVKADTSHVINIRTISGSSGALSSTTTEVPRESSDPLTGELAAVRTSNTSTMVGWTELANGSSPRARLRNIHDEADPADQDILRQLYTSASSTNHVAMVPLLSFVVVAFEGVQNGVKTLNLQTFYPFGNQLTDRTALEIEATTEIDDLSIQTSQDLTQLALAFTDASAQATKINAIAAWCVE